MKVDSFYTFNNAPNGLGLLRLVGRRTENKRTTYRIWQFERYQGDAEPTLLNWNIVLLRGKKWKYVSTTQLYREPVGYVVAKVSRDVPPLIPYWTWTLDEFVKNVRASVGTQPRYSDPKYFSQQRSTRKISWLHVNRQTLQLQSDGEDAESFRSVDGSYPAKRDAYEYIISRATALGMIDQPVKRLTLRARALQLNLSLLTL